MRETFALFLRVLRQERIIRTRFEDVNFTYCFGKNSYNIRTEESNLYFLLRLNESGELSYAFVFHLCDYHEEVFVAEAVAYVGV